MGNIQQRRWLILIVGIGMHFSLYAQHDLLRDLCDGKSPQIEVTPTFNISQDLISPLGSKAHRLWASTYTKAKSTTEKGLWIQYESERFLYKNRSLYLLANDSVRLEKVDLNDVDKIVKKTVKKLTELERRSPYALNIIQTLQQAENLFLIDLCEKYISYLLVPLAEEKWGVLNNNAYAFQVIETGNLLVDYAPFDQIGGGAEIRWCPREGLLKLAHELGHAYDANYGLLDDRLIDLNGNAIVAREVRAVFHENMIRDELNEEFRRTIQSGNAWIADGTPYTYPLSYLARH